MAGMTPIAFVSLTFVLSLIPMFYGASKTKLAQGAMWTGASLAIPFLVAILSYVVLAPAVDAQKRVYVPMRLKGDPPETKNEKLARVKKNALAIQVTGAWAFSVFCAFVVPAIGVSSIAKSAKRDRLREEAQKDRRGRSGRLGRSSGRHRKEKRVPCDQCAELIMPEARVCRFCGFSGEDEEDWEEDGPAETGAERLAREQQELERALEAKEQRERREKAPKRRRRR